MERPAGRRRRCGQSGTQYGGGRDCGFAGNPFRAAGKSVILAHRLNEGHEAGLKERYARLIASESRTLLPPADAQNKDTAQVK